jgi:mono/diheme cytochrome c family protein
MPALVTQAQDASERSTLAGVYSNEQADRGRTLFEVKCQSCHGDALEGGTLAPALKGREFLTAFQRKPLRRLYSRIISTMPPEDAGTLTEGESLALVALVLRRNGYRAGDAALASADDLNMIVVEMPPEKNDERSRSVR